MLRLLIILATALLLAGCHDDHVHHDYHSELSFLNLPSIDPDDPLVGEDFTLSFGIINDGDFTASHFHWVVVRDDGLVVDTGRIDDFRPGETAEIDIILNEGFGRVSYTIIIDSEDDIAEDDEIDNGAVITFDVLDFLPKPQSNA